MVSSLVGNETRGDSIGSHASDKIGRLRLCLERVVSRYSPEVQRNACLPTHIPLRVMEGGGRGIAVEMRGKSQSGGTVQISISLIGPASALRCMNKPSYKIILSLS